MERREVRRSVVGFGVLNFGCFICFGLVKFEVLLIRVWLVVFWFFRVSFFMFLILFILGGYLV